METKNYIIIYEYNGNEFKLTKRLSANRDTAIQQAMQIINEKIQEENNAEYRFVNIVEA